MLGKTLNKRNEDGIIREEKKYRASSPRLKIVMLASSRDPPPPLVPSLHSFAKEGVKHCILGNYTVTIPVGCFFLFRIN